MKYASDREERGRRERTKEYKVVSEKGNAPSSHSKSINWKTVWEINYYKPSPIAAVEWLHKKLCEKGASTKRATKKKAKRKRAPSGDPVDLIPTAITIPPPPASYQYNLLTSRTEKGRLVCVVEAVVTAVGDYFSCPPGFSERNATAIRKELTNR